MERAFTDINKKGCENLQSKSHRRNFSSDVPPEYQNLCFPVEEQVTHRYKKLLNNQPSEVAISAITHSPLRQQQRDRRRRNPLPAGKSGHAHQAYGSPDCCSWAGQGYTVVTHNTGEFERVPNLKVVDWVE